MARRTSVIAAVSTLALLVPVVASAGPRVPTWVTRARGASSRTAPVAVAAGPGFSISRDDGDDTQGALDLRSMKITRGGTKDTVVFTNDTAVSNADIDPDNGNFAVLIDRNDDRTFDFGQYVYFYAGKLRGVLVNLRTNRAVDRTAPVARVNARTFRTVIQRSKIDSPGTYRFAVFTYSEAAPCTRKNACVDALPNRYPLVPLDHKAPSITVQQLDDFANDSSDDLTTPFEFTAADDPFGTGVASWIVQRKEVGADTGWEQVRKGTAKHPTVDIPGDQGRTFDVRVIVVDRQRNRKVSDIFRTSFAVDDRDPGIQYTGSTTTTSVPGAFLGTTTVVATGGTVSFTFTGGFAVCVVGGPVGAGQTAVVTATLNASPVSIGDETDATALRDRIGCYANGSGTHTLALTVTSAEGFVIDGFYVER
jgi:hypothetical protein